MHVPKLTAKSIYRSFLLSGKKHLLLTGRRGIGKSTLLKDILPFLSSTTIPGITTSVEYSCGVFLKSSSNANGIQIGIFDSHLPGPGNQMRPVENVLLTQGIVELDHCARSNTEWCFIDEIGYLECSVEKYCHAILKLMHHKRLIAVIRNQDIPFLNSLKTRDDVFLYDLDAPLSSIGCVIMASGMGTRFGSNKLMADFDGQPLIAQILDATESLFSSRIVVTRHKDVAEYCQERNIKFLLHNFPFRNDTIRLGLEQMGPEISGCIFCPGDQPLLSQETLSVMALCHTHYPDCFWQLSYNNIPASPVLFPKWSFPMLMQLPEGKGGNVILQKRLSQVRYIQALGAHEVMDADTPKMLSHLKNIHH